jgi:hypothetical protein
MGYGGIHINALAHGEKFPPWAACLFCHRPPQLLLYLMGSRRVGCRFDGCPSFVAADTCAAANTAAGDVINAATLKIS